MMSIPNLRPILLSLLLPAVVACQGVWACPCGQVVVPAADPGYNNIDGIAYSQTIEYRREFEDAIVAARRVCESHMGIANRAVVSDLDETLFDNREFDAANPKFDQNKWVEWVREERAPVLKDTAAFLTWARTNGYAIFLVTTRGEHLRRNTINNLIKQGISYDGLFMRPPGNRETHQTLKTAFRKHIQEMGFTIVVNVGDQFSDLAGGYALDCEKVPNRMYFKK